VYAETPKAIAAPAGFTLLRQGRAGQVHFHLLARAAPPAPETHLI